MAEIIGRIAVGRKHHPDGSVSVYLRWRENAAGRTTYHRKPVIRSGPAPTKAHLNDCIARARIEAYEQAKLVLNGETEAKPHSLPLAEAASVYLQEVEGSGEIAETTLGARFRVVWGFVEQVRGVTTKKLAGQLSSADLARWAAARGADVADATLNNELGHLQAFLDACHRHEWITTPLAVKPHKRRVYHRAPLILEDDTIRRILRGEQDPMKHLGLAVLAGTGMRPGEIAGLATTGWNGRELSILASGRERTKHHSRAFQPGPKLAALLDAWHSPADSLFNGAKPWTIGRWLTGWAYPTG